MSIPIPPHPCSRDPASLGQGERSQQGLSWALPPTELHGPAASWLCLPGGPHSGRCGYLMLVCPDRPPRRAEHRGRTTKPATSAPPCLPIAAGVTVFPSGSRHYEWPGGFEQVRGDKYGEKMVRNLKSCTSPWKDTHRPGKLVISIAGLGSFWTTGLFSPLRAKPKRDACISSSHSLSTKQRTLDWRQYIHILRRSLCHCTGC